jgi:hypothetical protein
VLILSLLYRVGFIRLAFGLPIVRESSLFLIVDLPVSTASHLIRALFSCFLLRLRVSIQYGPSRYLPRYVLLCQQVPLATYQVLP